jgi:twitching motility protein PilT
MQTFELLKLMVTKGASDLHLMVGSRPVMRIDGELVKLDTFPPLTPADTESALEQLSNKEQLAAFRGEHELDFDYSVPGLSRFRVNILQQRGSVSVAVRLVPFKIASMEELGLPPICRELMLKPRGLILITGAAGSGKSTTLAAMIEYLNQTCARNIITIEDPIEYIFQNKMCLIHQRDLGDDTRSFSTALVHALRHDPDVIAIGEMRDLATISTAIRAAETGHLVVGTLHTNDAPQTLDRLIDVFPPAQQRQVRLQLSQVVEAVLSQRLLPRIGGGRVAAFEIMICTRVLRKYIREEKIFEITDHMDHAGPEGSQTMDRALAALVLDGVVTYEDALAKCSRPDILNRLIADKRSKDVPQAEPEAKPEIVPQRVAWN